MLCALAAQGGLAHIPLFLNLLFDPRAPLEGTVQPATASFTEVDNTPAVEQRGSSGTDAPLGAQLSWWGHGLAIMSFICKGGNETFPMGLSHVPCLRLELEEMNPALKNPPTSSRKFSWTTLSGLDFSPWAPIASPVRQRP